MQLFGHYSLDSFFLLVCCPSSTPSSSLCVPLSLFPKKGERIEVKIINTATAPCAWSIWACEVTQSFSFTRSSIKHQVNVDAGIKEQDWQEVSPSSYNLTGTAYFLHSFGIISNVRQIFVISRAQAQCCENMSKEGALGRYHRGGIFTWQWWKLPPFLLFHIFIQSHSFLCVVWAIEIILALMSISIFLVRRMNKMLQI